MFISNLYSAGVYLLNINYGFGLLFISALRHEECNYHSNI